MEHASACVRPVIGHFAPVFAIFFLSLTGCGSGNSLLDGLDNQGETNQPVARISSSEQVRVGSQVSFDAAPSADPFGLGLTYAWLLAQIPNGSGATLTSAAASVTSLFADKGGYYTVSLTVTNSNGLVSVTSSSTVDVVGTGSNHPPVAVIDTVIASGVAALDASGSYDIDGSPLTYLWEVTNDLTGATISIENPHAAKTVLTSSTLANLLLRLTVSDGTDSDIAYLTVKVSP